MKFKYRENGITRFLKPKQNKKSPTTLELRKEYLSKKKKKVQRVPSLMKGRY